MINYSKDQTDKIKALILEKKESIKQGNQGSDLDNIMGIDFLDKLREVNPEIQHYTLNYHSCQGKRGVMIAATIGLGNDNTKLNQINGITVRGFKVLCSKYHCGGYLQNYIRI